MNILSDLNYLKHHIILLVIVVGLAFGGIYTVESLVAKHDIANASRYSLILKQQEQQTASLSAQIKNDEANSQRIEMQLFAQNTQLTQEMSVANRNLAVQIQKNASLTAEQAASQIAASTQGIASASGNSVILDLLTARKVSDALITLPVVQTELIDTTKQLKNTQTILTNTQTDVTQQKALVTGLQSQLVDETQSCKAQIAVVKAKARKSKFKWFLAGVVTGFIGKKLITGSW